MQNKIIAVTEPDDILQDGTRILLVDLTQNQMQILSQALNQLEDFPVLITYIWNYTNSIDWLLDKKHKSDLIFFNAESANQTVVGYLSAQPNSYYLGTLQGLNKANSFVVYDVNQAVEILDRYIKI
jgi:hypothetical protein